MERGCILITSLETPTRHSRHGNWETSKTRRKAINGLAPLLGFSSNANYGVVIIRNSGANHFEIQLLPQMKTVSIGERRCKSKQIHSLLRRNLSELIRNPPAVDSLWICCSSSCFEHRGLYATTVD